ncbi:MAG: hypothetical protein LQ340_007483 [Diploschistes diacapsis]|nr:MAG: hypothetical protein LQ340_007483 [Diploschistes diacapsis]
MASPQLPDPYKVLGVGKDATLATIRSAHRKLVLACHPDKCQDEALKAQKADEFHRVQQAYELLSDDQKRTRYDEKCKLAELRAEVTREGGNARKAAAAYDHGPRMPGTGYWEPRREPVVEIRPGKPRYYNDEPPRELPRASPRFEDYEHRSRRYEDPYDMPASNSSSKKATSSRMYKEEPRSEDAKSRVQRRFREAATKIATDKSREHEDRRKARDRDRRDSYQTKRYQPPPRVDSASETEPEVEEFMTPRRSAETKSRYEPVRRSKRDEDTRRRRTDDSDSSDVDHHHKSLHNFQSAAEYIMRVKGGSERDHRHRPTVSRSQTSKPAPAPDAPSQPQVPILSSVDSSAKRSSARRGAVASPKASPKERKMPEIVEPASSTRRTEYDSGRSRPNLPSAAATSPLTAKGEPGLGNMSRAKTFETRASEKQPSMRRVHTSPLNPVNPPTGHAPSKSSSKPREAHDSGYSSPGTPDMPVPPKSYRNTTYKIVQDPDGDDSDVSRPTVIAIEPEARRRTDRELSPRTSSHRYERPSAQPRAPSRTTPTRASTLQDERSPPPSRTAPLNRASTERADGRHRGLWGEITSPEPRSADLRSPTGYKVNYAAPISEESISYSEGRRGRRDSRAKDRDRDAYAYERGGRNGGQSPGLGQRTTRERVGVY